MADEVYFNKEMSVEENLNKLYKMVLVDARYPVFVCEGDTYSNTINQQTARIWSEEAYNSLSELAQRVRSHAMKIDRDEASPASFYSVDIDRDGYLSFRIGGHLPPRITYKISTVMRENNKTSVADVKALFATEDYSCRQLLHKWDDAFIYEDRISGTSTRQSPPRK